MSAFCIIKMMVMLIHFVLYSNQLHLANITPYKLLKRILVAYT
jgi:hypothetical protein